MHESDTLISQVKNLEKKLSRRPKKRDDGRLNYLAKKYFGSWNNLMRAAGYSAYFHQHIDGNAPLNEEFAYFLGILITDGHIQYVAGESYKVAVYTSHTEEKQLLVSLIKSLFNYEARLTCRKYGFNKLSNWEIRISSRALAEQFMGRYGIPCGHKSFSVQVPPAIFSAPNSIQESFLRGVIDGDGTISPVSVRISSGSFEFLSGLKLLLTNLGFYPSKIMEDRRTYTTYVLAIHRKEDKQKIRQMYLSPLCYPRKKESASKI